MRNLGSFLLISLIIAAQPVRAENNNPFFGDSKHQVALNVSLGVESGFIVPAPARIVPFNEFHFQYSVPATLFYLPARFSINLSQMAGYGRKYDWDWRDFTIPVLYLTEDVLFFNFQHWYGGAGAGAGFQISENERIGSKLIFAFKVFVGHKFNDSFGMEVYMKHFSNGNTAPENNSYGFWGLGATYTF
jgi:hypothetical protein